MLGDTISSADSAERHSTRSYIDIRPAEQSTLRTRVLTDSSLSRGEYRTSLSKKSGSRKSDKGSKDTDDPNSADKIAVAFKVSIQFYFASFYITLRL